MAARYETEILSVDGDRPEPLVDAVAAGAAGGGWVNIEPMVDDGQRSDVPGIFAWFSARGPQVPVGTFVAGSDRSPASVGIEHGTGRDAGDRLNEAGVGAPVAWLPRQDHPKRGLVWEVHSGDLDAEVVVDLLLRATALLCPLPHEGRWSAAVSRPA